MGLLEGVATAAAPVRRMNASLLAVSQQRMSQGVAESKREFRSVPSIAEMTIGDAQGASPGMVLRLRSEEP